MHEHKVTYVVTLPATRVTLPLLSISVTHFGLLSFAQSSTQRQIPQHSMLFRENSIASDPLSGPMTDKDKDMDQNKSRREISQDAKNTSHLS